jgi:predicted molibdopterin-dependent oxidoreductase YjgC
MARQEPRTLTMEIDGRTVSFPEGVTVLRAAELNGIDIPSLCSHKDLSPFGGCRLCMVEIEGLRGYPLSCTTAAEEGMKVRTDSEALREFRREMLRLILSEHPSSCLVCGESAGCQSYQGTIRKAGVTTGCRFCPNDEQCELQDVIAKIGLESIDYPILYHGFEPEHDDPFYDRDYNLCILCGRCVRMCQEVRGSSVLAFTLRGSQTKVGPAFGRSHIEAGCEFCGACVDVCPTGALTDKASKWEGKPDGHHVSTCPFCAVGCQIELQHKNGRLIKVKAHMDPEVNDGQLCVRGRFCLPETTHHFGRARKPMVRKGEFFREVPWEEALTKAAEELRAAGPDGSALLVSPDFTNEGLHAARKFVQECLGSANIDSTARRYLAGGLRLWTALFGLPISIKELARSDTILAVGLDSRFDFSVVGTKVRQAIAAGARLVTIDPRDSNLARYTDDWLRPQPGREGLVLRALAAGPKGGKASLDKVAEDAALDPAALKTAAKILASGEHLSVIIGPQAFHYGDTEALVEGLRSLAGRGHTNFIPLYFGANSRGALELGVLTEVAPGGQPREKRGRGMDEILAGTWRPRVLYLAGDSPFLERPDCDFLIVQDTYLPPFQVDLFLPAASFAEAGGTLVSLEGRVQEVVQVEKAAEGARQGYARPDWRIFAELAGVLGCRSMNFKTSQDVFKDIRRTVPGFPAGVNRRPRRFPPVPFPKGSRSAAASPAADGLRLVARPGGFGHRSVDISSKVGGLKELALEEGFRMNPADLEALGLGQGDEIVVSLGSGASSAAGRVKADEECPRGAVYFTRPVVFGGLEDRRGMLPLWRLEANPVRVQVSRREA